LVVDDDQTIRRTIADFLQLVGYPVLTAANGAEAVQLVAECHPRLLLLDMRMPILDGWAVARALRATGSAPPIVVMTAARDARQWADELGAEGVVAKPFDLDELLAVVERLYGLPPAGTASRSGGS
jgi:CheY-like chemotaxis protein